MKHMLIVLLSAMVTVHVGAADKRKMPFEERIAKYEKSLEKTKRKNTQDKYAKKIAEAKGKIAEIDPWATGKNEDEDKEKK